LDLTKYNFGIYVLSTILILGLIPGCLDEEKDLPERFIVVEFAMNATMQEANLTVIENNCSVEMIYLREDGTLTYRVKVPVGEEIEYIKIFKSELNVENVYFFNEMGFNPREGDLSLIIRMEQTFFYISPNSIYAEITLENICSMPLIIEDLFDFGDTLWPKITDINGYEVRLPFGHGDYTPTYSSMKPGEKKTKIVDIEYSLNWDRPGPYYFYIWYSPQAYGNTKSIGVQSNTISFFIHAEDYPINF
jgi:hypothetical protein